jgi:pimeloyl-ACP methyl ester carboxylesterase
VEKQRSIRAHSDGVSIASAAWVRDAAAGHLGLDPLGWTWRPLGEAFVEGLSDGGRRRLIRFDMRGSGLSDRNVKDISVPARVRDIEAVVDYLGRTAAIFA